MRASSVISAMKTCIRIQQPVHIWGPPGVGKSDAVRQTAADLNMELRDIRAVLFDPVDLRGLPYVNSDSRAHWAIPEFLPRDGEGILFIDELTSAPPLVQAGFYQLILDRKLGEYTLPPGWAMVAAGNRESDRGVVYQMPTPLRNRFTHLDFECNFPDWEVWANDNDIDPNIIAFLKFRTELLLSFDKEAKAERAFATPRSWAFSSRILKCEPSRDVEYDLLAGTVGKGAATEFYSFLKLRRDLPSLEEILKNPLKVALPKEASLTYAVAIGVSRAIDKHNCDDAM